MDKIVSIVNVWMIIETIGIIDQYEHRPENSIKNKRSFFFIRDKACQHSYNPKVKVHYSPGNSHHSGPIKLFLGEELYFSAEVIEDV